MQASYSQFCPVAMAAEVLCTRWTILLLRELVAGSTRFNDLRRGVPRMSSALLSRRLKELQAAGIVERIGSSRDGGAHEYHLTEAGRDLRSVIETIGIWGQRWVEAEVSLENLDPALLMWDMRRSLDTTPLPQRRSVIEFLYTDLPESRRHWWLIVERSGATDLCSADPGFEVDLYVTTELKPMTSIWLGLSTVKDEQEKQTLALDGDRMLAREMQTWLGLSPFATERKRV
ncbi:winged helix-turn-helix transcriptional regulator [Pelagibius marinus]|uniref:winged helix-turn-helix transcriptional regulator n=1 Tax=Pelagibius marinus TaxID=2762760 RepID=UPI001872554F|nr:helix-turn-helix domain-containing protein [Pelagibius marinus]